MSNASRIDHNPANDDTDTEMDSECFVGSLDQGTTSTRFIIFNRNGDPVAAHQIAWHEHDALELLASAEECVAKAVAEFRSKGHATADISCVGITNQRETTVVWDATTGEPLCNAVVWPDTRTSALVRELRARDGADRLQDVCGLPLSTYPSSVKLVWLLRNVDAVRSAYDRGTLAFGTVDSWLIYRLNGGAKGSRGSESKGSKESDVVHVTDTTNASRTMFMNLRTRQYDDELLSFFGIDRTKVCLPTIVPSSSRSRFGSFADGPLAGVPITGCLGDQSAALVGQRGFSPGQAKNTYGTGCFLLCNVGVDPVVSKRGLLSTVAYDFSEQEGQPPAYALEGSIAVAGAGVNFLVSNLSFADDAAAISELASQVPDNGGVVFVTAFSGLFAPYWIDDAKGTLFGITQHTQKGHIARATLEAVCYQTQAILVAMTADSGRSLTSLAVDGGLSTSDLCMQIQADVSGIRVARPAMSETTSLGAAVAAGLALGIWPQGRGLGPNDLDITNSGGGRVFEPQMRREESDAMLKKWERAVKMSRGWVRETDHVDI